MGSYGRSFTLKDKNDNGVGATAIRAGDLEQYTRENGFLAFYEMCKMPLTIVQQNPAKAP